VHYCDVDYDGLFVSNGPGNPEMCLKTVEQLRLILAREPAKPVFGICLGHQLLSLAAGASTYKMKLAPHSSLVNLGLHLIKHQTIGLTGYI